jgi:hypothetical protein
MGPLADEKDLESGSGRVATPLFIRDGRVCTFHPAQEYAKESAAPSVPDRPAVSY